MYRTIAAIVAFACALGAARADEPQAYAWWEAEKPVESDFPDSSWLDPQSEREADVLSGGAWLTRGGEPAGKLEAVYDVQVPRDGEYELWVRKFARTTPFLWRFDDGDWAGPEGVGRMANVMPLDISGMRYVTVGWQMLGKVKLAAGRRRFHLQLTDAPPALVAIDCFALVGGHFRPHGRAKPGQGYDRAPEGWFPFEPGVDHFGDSPIDLRALNDREAGMHGRVRARGDKLVFDATGEEVRFWGVTAGASSWSISHEDMDYLARHLAKRGVNMVRFHVAPYYETEPGEQTDGVHYLTAALKKQGIYCGYNWYCLACAKVQESWGLEGFEPGDRPFSLHLFYPPLQDLYRRWARTLFGTVNPYTGMTLAEDPATAYIELIDEDNYLFHTFKPANINPVALPFLEREFGAWAAAKYGSIEKALAAWGKGPLPRDGEDAPGEGRLALYPAMAFGGQDWAVGMRNQRRAEDQMRFMVEDQRAFYAGMKDWLRDELGYDGVVVGTNWKTVDERVVGPLDMYSNMAVDATARNTYFSGGHKRTKFHPWMVGDAYVDRTILRDPEAAITMHMQYAGHPHFITEGGWAMPNRFRTEEQLVMAAYGSLQGIDALFPFALEPYWAHTMNQWPIQTAATIGQYPAASIIYRKGYVAEGPVAVGEALRLDDLYALKGAAMSQPLGLDSHRVADVPDGVPAEVESLPGMDPLAFYVGRVLRDVGEDPGASKVLSNLPELIDREAKIVRSATGQLTLDFGRGLLTVNAPKAQGVTGFLAGAGAIETADATFRLWNEYAAAVIVPLDDLPIAESRLMLLQVMTEEKAFNWETKPVRTSMRGNAPEVDALEITNIGTAPLVVRKIAGSIALKRADAASVNVMSLDYNGYLGEGVGTADAIELKPWVIYYLLAKRQ